MPCGRWVLHLKLEPKHPGRAIWSGFLVTSALAGSGFVLMLAIIGVFLLPVMLISRTLRSRAA